MPVTLIENVHELELAMLAPERLTTPGPCVAVIVPAPHVPVRPFGVETTKPAGSVSLKPTPVRGVPVLLFWMVNESDVEPFSGMLAAPNALMITGGPTTVIEAFVVLPVPPSVEVTWVELFFTPAVVPCTSMEKEQDALGAWLPPESETLEAPAVAVTVPPQLLPLMLGGVATTSPAGRLSVNAIPFSVTFVFGLLMVKLSEVVPFSGIEAAPKSLVIDGGDATVRFAVAVLPVPPLVEVTLPVVFVY